MEIHNLNNNSKTIYFNNLYIKMKIYKLQMYILTIQMKYQYQIKKLQIKLDKKDF